MAHVIKVFCWILDVSDSSFSVDIKDNLTVDDLKLAIVQKYSVSFDKVDAFELVLWKVSGFHQFSIYSDNFPTRYPL
jgi:hypothetical protein